MALITSINLNIAKKLENDKSFRERFFRGQAQDKIAMSIRNLRKKRRKRQTDIAKESNMKQSAISRIEQADYSGWSFNTLFRIADALDARLQISFEPAEDVIGRYREKELACAVGQKQCATTDDKLMIGHTHSIQPDSLALNMKNVMPTVRTEGLSNYRQHYC
jgi:transcriptional regulator with XRE-family HTH domain